MTQGQITTALDMHGIRYHELAGTVWAWEEATMRTDSGVADASMWIKAPTTKRAMLAWLGY